MHNIMYFLGLEEAYSGPCGSMGCVGRDGSCGSYVVVRIGNWTVTRDCRGTNSNDPDDDNDEEDTEEPEEEEISE